MNENFIGGNEMHSGRMGMDGCQPDRASKASWLRKSMASLMGVLLICASANVVAEVCEVERQGVISASERNKDPWMGHYTEKDLTTSHMIENVEQELNDGGDFRYMGCAWHPDCDYFAANKGTNKPSSPKYRDALLVWADIQDNRLKQKVGRGELDFAYYRFRGCIARSMAANLNATSGNTASSANRTSPTKSASPESSANTSPEAKRLNTQLSEATALAQKHQDDVDRARKGKPKRHVLGAEAHNCLTLIQDPGYGGFINSCPYAVEYYYCAYKPKKDSWAESFDCEKQKMGAWQIGAGPNNRDGAHTKNAEMIYWFACKYGPTLHNPDGVSPADIEFQPGRGLMGRCAEWGSGGKS